MRDQLMMNNSTKTLTTETRTIRRVLSTDGLDPGGVALLREAGLEVVQKKMTKAELMTQLCDYDAVIVRSATKIDGDIIRATSATRERRSRLRVIGRAGTGVDNIDVDAASDAGLLVINTPAANTLSAAEHTLALLLALSRHIPQACGAMSQGRWQQRASFMGTELFGKTLAILGLGRIGREVAVRAQAFGMRTIGYDPLLGKEEAAKFGVEALALEEMWPLADYITVHVPLVPDTEGLLGLQVLRKCKSGVVKVVNCSRGGIVNESELLEALDSGVCAGAALDVFSEEPPNLEGPLFHHPKVICTPHLGASTKEAQFRVSMEMAQNLVAVSRGSRAQGLVNGLALSVSLVQGSGPWTLLLSSVAKALQPPPPHSRVHVFVDLDSSPFTKERGFQDFVKATLARAILGGDSTPGLNLVNSALEAARRGLDICVTHREGPRDSVSVGVEIQGRMVEVSEKEGRLFLTKIDLDTLDQPVLLKRDCVLAITTTARTALDTLASRGPDICSFSVDRGRYILVTESIVLDNFELVVPF